MKQTYPDLSALLRDSTAAEAYFSQMPEWLQEKARQYGGTIHSARELRSLAEQWSREERT